MTRLEGEVWRFVGIVCIFIITAQVNCGDEEPDPCEDWTWMDEEACLMDRCAMVSADDSECREGECWCCDDVECWRYE